jgi:hypothetical protein
MAAIRHVFSVSQSATPTRFNVAQSREPRVLSVLRRAMAFPVLPSDACTIGTQTSLATGPRSGER